DIDKISTAVMKIKNSINMDAMNNDDVRLTGQWVAAKQVVGEMQAWASDDTSMKGILDEVRSWDFNEFFPMCKKNLTVDGMLEQVKEDRSCMNYLGGQVAGWLSELVKLPKAPKR